MKVSNYRPAIIWFTKNRDKNQGHKYISTDMSCQFSNYNLQKKRWPPGTTAQNIRSKHSLNHSITHSLIASIHITQIQRIRISTFKSGIYTFNFYFSSFIDREDLIQFIHTFDLLIVHAGNDETFLHSSFL